MNRVVPLAKALGLSLLMLAPSALHARELVPRIINGVETDQFESVGIVGSRRLGGFCTGTLISPYHVLTAAHCAELIDGPTNGTFEVDGTVYETSQVYIHPDFNRRTLTNDIAILELSEPVLDVLPSPIYRGTPLVNDVLVIVGYGEGGTAASGGDGAFGTKMAGAVTIDEVTETLIIWTFDDESESNTAAGDSGGPGMLEIDGEFYVTSITSAGTEPDAGLGDVAFNTRVDAYAFWIDSIVEAFNDQETGQDDGNEQDNEADEEGGGDTGSESGDHGEQDGGGDDGQHVVTCPPQHDVHQSVGHQSGHDLNPANGRPATSNASLAHHAARIVRPQMQRNQHGRPTPGAAYVSTSSTRVTRLTSRESTAHAHTRLGSARPRTVRYRRR